MIVFFPDTVRAESLSSYGHPFVSTPNTDRLAAEGVLFEQAHAQHTQCSPSRCAVFTGRYMHVLGHRTQNHLLQPTEPNVFAYLKAAGYTTISIGKNDALSAGAFNRTFSYWVNEDGVPQGSNRFAFGEAGYYSFGYNASDEPGNSTSRNKNTDYVAALTVAKLLSGGKLPEPFAIFVTGIGAHPPYSAPIDYYSMYSAAQVASQAPLRVFSPGQPPHLDPSVGIAAFRNLKKFNDSFFCQLAAVYLGRVSFVDALMGVMLDALDASTYVDRTAFFFSSDHGDYSGDFHAPEKYPCGLDDVLTHVPLIARVPGGLKGARIPAPVETLDLFATLLNLAGLLSPALSGPGAIERHFSNTLLPALMGWPNASVASFKPFVHSEGGYSPGTAEVEPLDPAQAAIYADPTNLYYPRGQEELLATHCTRAVMMRNATAKLVYRPAPGTSELYDLAADPRERTNLYGSSSARALQTALVYEMLDWLTQTSDITPFLEDQRGDAPSPPVPDYWPTVPLVKAGR